MFTVKKVKAVLFVLNFLFVEIETQPLAMTMKCFCPLFSKSERHSLFRGEKIARSDFEAKPFVGFLRVGNTDTVRSPLT